MKRTVYTEPLYCNVCGKELGRNDLRKQRICRRHYHLSRRNPQQYMEEVRKKSLKEIGRLLALGASRAENQ